MQSRDEEGVSPRSERISKVVMLAALAFFHIKAHIAALMIWRMQRQIAALERRGAQVLHAPALKIAPNEQDGSLVAETRALIRQEEEGVTVDAVVLSPFTVEASTEKGYLATQTLNGTRLKTELKDMADDLGQSFKEEFAGKGSVGVAPPHERELKGLLPQIGSLVGAIVGELPTGAQEGLGARLLSGSYYGQTLQIWAALAMAGCWLVRIWPLSIWFGYAPRSRPKTKPGPKTKSAKPCGPAL